MLVSALPLVGPGGLAGLARGARHGDVEPVALARGEDGGDDVDRDDAGGGPRHDRHAHVVAHVELLVCVLALAVVCDDARVRVEHNPPLLEVAHPLDAVGLLVEVPFKARVARAG